jgi:hypothetical protein
MATEVVGLPEHLTNHRPTISVVVATSVSIESGSSRRKGGMTHGPGVLSARCRGFDLDLELWKGQTSHAEKRRSWEIVAEKL